MKLTDVNKFVIDEKKCLKHKLSLQEVMVALALSGTKSYTEVLENLILREILVYKDGKYYITQHWRDEIDEILIESSGTIDNEERLKKLAEEMQKCFPKGKMPGTAYYYRCNAREIIQKLKKFFAQYGDYPDDEIIDATKRFVASFQGNYRYMPLIKYFIMKNKTVADEDGENHITEVSELASYLENKEEEGAVVTNSDEWLMNAKN